MSDKDWPTSRTYIDAARDTLVHLFVAPACRSSVLCADVLLLVTYLDVPELSTLTSMCRYLASLAADPILQRTRLLVVAPSRLSHSLFAMGPEGSPLRPTISDLIRRGVMKGLDIERRWRAGLYLYSALARISSPFCCAPC
jgi:hypothetical protein